MARGLVPECLPQGTARRAMVGQGKELLFSPAEDGGFQCFRQRQAIRWCGQKAEQRHDVFYR